MTATLALADRLARLERTVATLQQQQSGGEALQPTYLTVDAQGRVSAQFSGSLELTEQGPPFLLDPTNALTWRDSSGNIHDYIQGSNNNGPHDLVLIAGAQGNPLTAQVELLLESDETGATAFMQAFAGRKAVSILDETGASSFLQLVQAQQLQLAEGSGTWTWPGGSTNSNVATINHGLGRTPRRVLIEPTVPANWVLHLATNRTTTSFDTTAQFPSFTPGAGYGLAFDWVAIG